MKILIIIPTYNESANIKKIILKIFNVDKSFHILVIDDNSPDKTYEIVQKLSCDYKNINLIKRSGKLGLGTAYCEGFSWAINNNYSKVVQIDADMSHDPSKIPDLVSCANNYDLVIGSRYIDGINVINWPLRRLILSYGANIYSKIITGLPIYDSTGGFKCFNINVLKSIDLEKIKSTGYSFQIEMNFITWVKGYKLKEVPIVFIDRQVGNSKMSKKIIFEAIYMVPYLRLKKMFKIIK